MKMKLLLIPAATLFCTAQVAAQEPPAAMATFIDAEGASVGSVTLTQSDNTVTIAGELTGIPAGEHGFHFHMTGECDPAVAFESAGEHFNPTDHQHGMENPEGPHAGDLMNITAGEDGTVAVELTTDMISLTESDDDPASVFDEDGTALVVHADPDDMVTDPSGNSGDRIACAVIEPGT
jgi:Cu-Zn family superoxide dismutase